MAIFLEVLGWCGTSLFVAAYWLVTIRKLDVSSRAYQLMNFIGSLGVGAHVFYQKAWPAFTLEVVWGGIAVWGLIMNRKRRSSAHISV